MSNLIKRSFFAIAFLAIASPLFADLANDTVWVRSTDQSMGFWMLKFSKNDAIIAANGYNDVLFFETATGNEIGRVPHSREVFFINDDTQFIKPNESKRTIEIWDIATFTVVDTLENDGTPITSQAGGYQIVDDNEQYYIAGIESGLRVWDLKTKQVISTFYSKDEEGLNSWSTGRKFFDCNDENIFYCPITKEYNNPDYGPGMGNPDAPEYLYRHHYTAFNIHTLDSMFDVPSYGDWVLSHNCKYVATKGADHQYGIEVYDFPTNELKYKLDWNRPSCTGIEFSADDKYLVTSSSNINDQLQIWSAETGESIYNDYSFGTYSHIAVSANSKWILAEIGGDLCLLLARYDGVGIEDMEEEVTQIYPNPTSYTINIEIDESIEYTIKIVDITGNILYHEDIINQSIFSYDVADLVNGNYFLQLISNQNIETYKFIKE